MKKPSKKLKREAAREALEMMGTVSIHCGDFPREATYRKAHKIRDRAARKALREWVNAD
jgi:hypothetical protein